jgi:hypothetical protein
MQYTVHILDRIETLVLSSRFSLSSLLSMDSKASILSYSPTIPTHRDYVLPACLHMHYAEAEAEAQ